MSPSATRVVAPASTKPLKIFISYAKKDRTALNELKSSLSRLKSDGRIEVFDDGDLKVGDKWLERIMGELETADVVMCLISNNFFDSKFISEKELKLALKLANDKNAKLMVVISEDSYVDNAPIMDFTYYPRNRKPLRPMKRGERNKIYTEICRELDSLAEELNSRRKGNSEDSTKPVHEKQVKVTRPYTFGGLSKMYRPLEDDDQRLIQDFRFEKNVRGKGIINNPISYLWADIRGNVITAHAIDNGGYDSDSGALEVTFKNNRETWRSNVCVHPQELRARKRTSHQTHLSFLAKAVDASPKPKGGVVVVGVRIIDELFQHWSYVMNAEMSDNDNHVLMFELPTDGSWKKCRVNLTARNQWKLFGSDGNRTSSASKVRFELIAGVIFTVGRKSDFTQGGSGKLLISNLSLSGGKKSK